MNDAHAVERAQSLEQRGDAGGVEEQFKVVERPPVGGLDHVDGLDVAPDAGYRIRHLGQGAGSIGQCAPHHQFHGPRICSGQRVAARSRVSAQQRCLVQYDVLGQADPCAAPVIDIEGGLVHKHLHQRQPTPALGERSGHAVRAVG